MTKKAAPAEGYSELRAFMHGYLHEDYVEEYGSARNAVKEFRADAEDDEFGVVAEQWRRFFQSAKTQPISAVQSTMLEQFGAGWTPASYADIEALTKLFQQPRAKEAAEE